jgi:UDP-4-amino-4,6-dideoxy-N-acetyl-beta-L-altrosamine transaminase
MIPYGRQEITQDDIEAVIEALKSDFITQGPKVMQFERAVAQKVGAKRGVAVNSATSALHLACRALAVGRGDLVWTSPITFVASANCARFCGADVDFVDIDPRTYNMCAGKLEAKLGQAQNAGRLPKVLIPVHMCGQSCDMASIYQLSRRYGFSVIEDASHAIGSHFKGEPVGNCRFSDITVFSFHPVKIITTAEGGMALTNRTDLAELMFLLRSHGITRDNRLMTHDPDGPWYYEQLDLGFNYRMTELQAALGLKQLERLDDYVVRRHHLADRYDKLLAKLPVRTPWQNPDAYSALHLYPIRIQIEKCQNSRRQIFESLQDQGIGVNVHYIPVHLQPYYRAFGFQPGDFPEAEKYYAETITLPLFPSMTEEQQDQVVTALSDAINPT